MIEAIISDGVYYLDGRSLAVIAHLFAEEEKQLGAKIAVELEPCATTSAEDYHQDYLKKNPGGLLPYWCDGGQPWLIRQLSEANQETLKAERQQRTKSQEARPFHNAYDQTFERIYVDITTGSSSLPDKFASGWLANLVPLPKMSSTITRTIAMEWSGSSSFPLEAAHLGRMSSPMDPKTKVAFAIASIQYSCFIPKEERWSKRTLVIYLKALK